FSYYIAKRYLFSKSSNNAVNFMSKLAGLGVVVGSAALFIVLCGFNGLKDYSLAFTSFVDPDLKIVPVKTKTFMVNDSLLSDILQLDNFLSYTKTVEENVFLSTNQAGDVVSVKGVSESFPSKTVDSILFDGEWISDSNQIVSGWGIANKLSFGVYDYSKAIALYAPKPGEKQILSVDNSFSKLNVVNVGLFEINEALDFSVIYAGVRDVQNLLGYAENQVSSLEIMLKNPLKSKENADLLSSKLGPEFKIKTKEQLNDTLYKMLNTEEITVYLVFTLVLIIALFNLISSIIIMILEKRSNLKTLYNSGATHGEIKKIFYYQGLIITFLGGGIGLFVGVLLTLLQQNFSVFMITPSLAYPVSIDFNTFLIVSVTILILGGVASKISSSVVTKELVGKA
ncbi:FtsX-like permease family protein, partial [Flavobacteriaceae bacterium]|nr:FtsX-like permease family protein [Flavobacteriaceae bacterium]